MNQPTRYAVPAVEGALSVLETLANAPQLGVSELAKRLGLSKGSAYRLLATLVRRGYVGRKTDPSDRRRVLLGITSRGEKRLRDLRQGSGGIMNEWLAELGKDDLEALAHGLRALAEVVSAEKTRVADHATVENAGT